MWIFPPTPQNRTLVIDSDKTFRRLAINFRLLFNGTPSWTSQGGGGRREAGEGRERRETKEGGRLGRGAGRHRRRKFCEKCKAKTFLKNCSRYPIILRDLLKFPVSKQTSLSQIRQYLKQCKIVQVRNLREGCITLNSTLQLSVFPPAPRGWRNLTEEQKKSHVWWEREALYKAWGENGAPLISIRVRPVKTRAQEVKEIKQAELQMTQAWQEALQHQRAARCWQMARQLPVPELCIDYFKKKRKRQEEERKRQEEEPFVSIQVRRKTPVKAWYFQCMLWAELQKERRLEEWVQNSGPFEPQRVARPRRDFKQVLHDLKEKYVVDTKTQ